MYPQKKEAGIEQKSAREVIMPKSINEPPIIGVTTKSGMKTESIPNAISWKKNPNRHIGNKTRGKLI
jgi:hypothetical protein